MDQYIEVQHQNATLSASATFIGEDGEAWSWTIGVRKLVDGHWHVIEWPFEGNAAAARRLLGQIEVHAAVPAGRTVEWPEHYEDYQAEMGAEKSAALNRELERKAYEP